MVPGYTKIGQIIKAVGLEGFLNLEIEAQYREALDHAAVLFLDTEGQLVPFFIEELVMAIPIEVLFEDIKSREAARVLSGAAIYLPIKSLPAADTSKDGLLRLNGYTIKDKNTAATGQIMMVEQYPQQLMATVNFENEQRLIPLVEAWIISLDVEKFVILMDLPAGILDL